MELHWPGAGSQLHLVVIRVLLEPDLWRRILGNDPQDSTGLMGILIESGALLLEV